MIMVSFDRWRDGMKFLMGLGSGPSLTPTDQRRMKEVLRGPWAQGMKETEARKYLRDGMRWCTPAHPPLRKMNSEDGALVDALQALSEQYMLGKLSESSYVDGITVALNGAITRDQLCALADILQGVHD